MKCGEGLTLALTPGRGGGEGRLELFVGRLKLVPALELVLSALILLTVALRLDVLVGDPMLRNALGSKVGGGGRDVFNLLLVPVFELIFALVSPAELVPGSEDRSSGELLSVDAGGGAAADTFEFTKG